MRSPHDVIEDAERYRRSLFGLCYRMTGCPADAEELVQETFARALERPPMERDVLGLSAIEVGGMLELEPGHVRVLHHRARRALEGAEAPSLPADVGAHAAALMRLLEALGRGDAEAAVALLAEDAVAVQDANGAYVAAVRVIRGNSTIVDFYKKISKLRAPPSLFAPQSLNGLPAVAVVYPDLEPRYAPRAVVSVALDETGRIGAIRGVLAPRKLAAVSFPTP